MDSTKNTKIDAILGEEFIQILEKLSVKDAFEAGKYKCSICGEILTYKNVLLVFPLSENDVGFVCKKPECITRYKLNNEKNKTGT
jgi:transcription initiation factor IIE alpha subunit